MNITNTDYFTFNVHNSLLLIGESGSGKTYLVRKLVERYVQAYKPDEVKFAFFDLKRVEFIDFSKDQEKRLYLLFDIQFGDEESFNILEQLKELSTERADNNIQKPIILIYIEECDMSCRDQNRFDNAVITINQNAKDANIKLIYSTSSPRPDTVSDKLLQSFDLILSGKRDDGYADNLGVPKVELKRFEFAVTERQPSNKRN